MRRLLALLAALALSCALVIAVPVGSGASPVAHPAAKKKCKKHRHHHRKRCRKKAAVDGVTTGGGVEETGPSGPPGRLLATEKEVSATQLQLQLSRPSLAAGSAIVEQYNAGSDPHNLILEKDGAVAFAYPTLEPGGDQRQTVALTPGTWILYCSLLDHRSLGMQATLTVN